MAENTLLEKVLSLQDKYRKLEESLADPAVIADMKKFVQLNKDYKELQPIIQAGLEYKRMLDELAQAKDILMNEKDEDLREMARDEVAEIEPKLPEMEQNIKLLLIPAEKEQAKKKKNSIASKVLKSVITAVTGVVAASVADSVTGTKKKSGTSTTKKAVQKATKSATNTITRELTRSILGNLIK